MLLLFSYLFISVGYVFGASYEGINYDSEMLIDDHVLKSVRTHYKSIKQIFIGEAGLVGIDKNAFENLSDTSLIYLKKNHIQNLPQSLFSPVKQLKRLILEKNELRDINFLFNVSTTLESLLLDDNNLSSLPDSALARCNHLQELSLTNNGLENVKFTHSLSPTLTHLGLRNNKISELPPGSFRHLNRLEHLDLSDNHITRLVSGAFDGLANMRRLWLSGNKITAIDNDSFKDFADTMESLVLSENKIQILKEGTFNFKRPYKLDLTRNQISEIEKGSFNMPNLKNLILEHNLLTSLKPENFTGLPQLTTLYLGSNPTNVSEKERHETLSNRDVLVKYT